MHGATIARTGTIMFRRQLPRVYELRDLAGAPVPPDAAFQTLEGRLQESPSCMEVFGSLERQLDGLDDVAWAFLKSKAGRYLTVRHATRGWQQLVDALNEVRAYNYLKTIGCSDVQFIEESAKPRQQSPDLRAVLHGKTVLCEVKSINVSDRELQARQDSTAQESQVHLDPGFLRKLKCDTKNAWKQLQAYIVAGEVRYFVYFIVCFDDWSGDYDDRYVDEIRRSLNENAISGRWTQFWTVPGCVADT